MHRSRRGSCSVLAALLMSSAASAQTAPNLSGVWRLDGAFSEQLKTVEGKAPPLLPNAVAIYRERQAKLRAGDHSFDNASAICVSPGMPRMMFLPYAFQIIQSQQQMVFLYEWNDRHRIVNMSGKPLDPPDLFYMGTASGRVEGDTLIIETTGLTNASLLDASGMPHSDALQLTERYRLADADTMVDEITITDPRTFSKPWTAQVSYKRQPAGTGLQEDVCRERVQKGGPAFERDRWK